MERGSMTEGDVTPEIKEREVKPLEGEYREAWAKFMPNPEEELYIDTKTGEAHGAKSDMITTKKDEKTNEWIVTSGGKQGSPYDIRVPVDSGESNLFMPYNDMDVRSCPRDWSVWKENRVPRVDLTTYSSEKFADGERGEKQFTDLQSAVDFILDQDEAYELRDGNGHYRGGKPNTGANEQSNSFNFGMVVRGKKSGKKITIENCARVNSEKLTVSLGAQEWYTQRSDRGESVIGKLSAGVRENEDIASRLEDDEVIIKHFRSSSKRIM